MASKSGSHRFVLLFLFVFVMSIAVNGQTTPQQQQTIPDAPSAKKKPDELPSAPTPQVPANPAPSQTPPAQTAPAQTVPADQDQQQAPPPPAQITTVPQGGATASSGSGYDNLEYTLRTTVNFVSVPVTVKNNSGQLVQGLTMRDFTVLEDDVPQRITFFTSDPFPLSAAVVLDLGMPDQTFAKIRNTLPALIGAFGQFDEISIFTYTNTVSKVQDFTAATNNHLDATVRRLKERRAAEGGGVPVTSGPFAQNNPTINGRPIDPGSPITNRNGSPTQTVSRVLNDAILEAALDLSQRPRARRKVIFVISDGRETGSAASYAEVLKVLLTRQIAVYGIGVGSAALPVIGQLEKIHVPGTGYGDLLPKYASATGGQVYDELTQAAIESAYARVTEEARNQYTIGYTTRATPSSTHRTIEVRVGRPGLKVYAKEGYYPLPPTPNRPQ